MCHTLISKFGALKPSVSVQPHQIHAHACPNLLPFAGIRDTPCLPLFTRLRPCYRLVYVRRTPSFPPSHRYSATRPKVATFLPFIPHHPAPEPLPLQTPTLTDPHQQSRYLHHLLLLLSLPASHSLKRLQPHGSPSHGAPPRHPGLTHCLLMAPNRRPRRQRRPNSHPKRRVYLMLMPLPPSNCYNAWRARSSRLGFRARWELPTGLGHCGTWDVTFSETLITC